MNEGWPSKHRTLDQEKGAQLVADDEIGLRVVDPQTGQLAGPIAPDGIYAMSPERSVLAVVKSDLERQSARISVRRADGSGFREIATTSQPMKPAGDVAITPDGRQVVVVTDSGAVHLIQPDSGISIPLQLRTGQFTPTVTTTDDGRILAQHDPTQLILTDLKTNEELGTWPYRLEYIGGFGAPAPIVSMPNGVLAASSPDGSVALWQTDVNTWVQQLCDTDVGGPGGYERQKYLAGVHLAWPCHSR